MNFSTPLNPLSLSRRKEAKGALAPADSFRRVTFTCESETEYEIAPKAIEYSVEDEQPLIKNLEE
jgi:hypothetical protein